MSDDNQNRDMFLLYAGLTAINRLEQAANSYAQTRQADREWTAVRLARELAADQLAGRQLSAPERMALQDGAAIEDRWRRQAAAAEMTARVRGRRHGGSTGFTIVVGMGAVGWLLALWVAKAVNRTSEYVYWPSIHAAGVITAVLTVLLLRSRHRAAGTRMTPYEQQWAHAHAGSWHAHPHAGTHVHRADDPSAWDSGSRPQPTRRSPRRSVPRPPAKPRTVQERFDGTGPQTIHASLAFRSTVELFSPDGDVRAKVTADDRDVAHLAHGESVDVDPVMITITVTGSGAWVVRITKRTVDGRLSLPQ